MTCAEPIDPFLLEMLVRGNRARRAAISCLVALIGLVGPSRIYLGHHWFTDVMASYLLGVAYLLGLMAIYRRVKTRWLNRGLPESPSIDRADISVNS